jgi:GAF domain-containing protein
LLADGRAIGLLRIDDPRPDAFDADARRFLTAAGVVIAAAIQNARSAARAASARVRVETLEHRFEQLRSLVNDVSAAIPNPPPKVEELLDAMGSALGEARTSIDMSDGPRVTL